MGIPQLRGEATDQTGTTTSFSVSFNALVWAAGDILEIAIATDGYVPTLSTANGFQLAQDPVGNSASVTTNSGTAGAADCGMFIFWKRATGSNTTADPEPVFAAATGGGTCWCLETNSYSGARSTGTPYHLIATSVLGTASTAVTSPSVTPTLANCLVMARVAGSNDDATFNNWAMTGASGPPSGTVASGWHVGSGNACSFTGDDGGYATAGGARFGTTTFGTSTKQARITLVMASLAEVGAITGTEATTSSNSAVAETGTVAVTATSARTSGAATNVAAGTVSVTGTAAVVSGGSTNTISGSSITVTGTSSITSGNSVTSAAGTVGGAAAATGTESVTSASSTVASAGTTSVGGTETVTSRGSATSSTGTTSVTGQGASTGGTSTVSAAGSVSTSAVLTMGKVAIRQKANTTSPNSGTLTTFAVYPAWQASHAYQLQDAIRITNAGNIYELQQDGTSASSGGPSTTAAAITDGTAKWNYLGPGTGAMDTQTSGSFFVATAAWGQDATGGGLPSDNKGNTYTQLSKNFYTGFPSSSNALYAATQPAAGGTGHTLTEAFGLSTNFGGDEMTEILAEVIGGTHIQDRSYVERSSSTANVVTSAAVTTTGPAILIAFWWLNGTVRANGTNHDAAPGSGFTEIPEGRALMEIGPGGAGEVQVTTHFRSVTTPGTYTASITTTSGEGSAVYLVAIQGSTADISVTSSGSKLSAAGNTAVAGTESTASRGSAVASAGSAVATGSVSTTASASSVSASAVTSTGPTGNASNSSSGSAVSSSAGALVTGVEASTSARSLVSGVAGTLVTGVEASTSARSLVSGVAGTLVTGAESSTSSGSMPSALGGVGVSGASIGTVAASAIAGVAGVLVAGSGSSTSASTVVGASAGTLITVSGALRTSDSAIGASGFVVNAGTNVGQAAIASTSSRVSASAGISVVVVGSFLGGASSLVASGAVTAAPPITGTLGVTSVGTVTLFSGTVTNTAIGVATLTSGGALVAAAGVVSTHVTLPITPRGHGHYITQFDTEPGMYLECLNENRTESLTDAIAWRMRWRRPDGAVIEVPLVAASLTAGAFVRFWEPGDTDLLGVHTGQVIVTRGSGGETTFPNDGTFFYWTVTDRL